MPVSNDFVLSEDLKKDLSFEDFEKSDMTLSTHRPSVMFFMSKKERDSMKGPCGWTGCAESSGSVGPGSERPLQVYQEPKICVTISGRVSGSTVEKLKELTQVTLPVMRDCNGQTVFGLRCDTITESTKEEFHVVLKPQTAEILKQIQVLSPGYTAHDLAGQYDDDQNIDSWKTSLVDLIPISTSVENAVDTFTQYGTREIPDQFKIYLSFLVSDFQASKLVFQACIKTLLEN